MSTLRQEKKQSSFSSNSVGGGSDVRAQYYAAVGVEVPEGTAAFKWVAVADGVSVWISAGAGYGPQVQFKTEADADAFAKEHNCGRPDAKWEMGKNPKPRVNIRSVQLFVLAFEAAKRSYGVTAPKEVAPSATEKPVIDDEALWAEFQAFRAFKAAQKK